MEEGDGSDLIEGEKVGEVNYKDTNGISLTENGSDESVECEVVKNTVSLKKRLISDNTDIHRESNGCIEELEEGSNSENGTAMNGNDESKPVECFSDGDDDLLFETECTISTVLVESQSILELREKNSLDGLDNHAESVVELLISNGLPENTAQHNDRALDECNAVSTESSVAMAPVRDNVNGLNHDESLVECGESRNK